MTAYLIETTRDDNGTLLVTCPAFPEVTTFGADEHEALANAISAIEEAIAARIHDGDPLPRPVAAAPKRHGMLLAKLPLLSSLKVELVTAMRNAGVTRAELARRLGWHREQVDRLFRLDHASRVDQIEAAFAALGRSVDVRTHRRQHSA
jgi:antitoxin HicB